MNSIHTTTHCSVNNINHKTSFKTSVLSGTNRSMSYLPLACEFSRQQYRAAHARVWEQISPKTRMTRGLCQKIPRAKCQNEKNLLFQFTGISSRVVRPKSDEKGRDLLLAELAESALMLLHIKSPMHKTRKTQPSRISLLSDHQHRESSSWKSCLGLKTRGQDPKVLGLVAKARHEQLKKIATSAKRHILDVSFVGMLHRPGIEPGSRPWQGRILPLDQRCQRL